MTAELRKFVRMSGCGMHTPNNVVTNHQIIKKYGLNSSDAWVRENTGIVERHINDNPKIATSDMAVNAGHDALIDANIEPDQIDAVIVATTTPDYTVSGTAPIVKEKLKIKHAAAFDINAGCSGSVYGMTIAAALIESGRFKNVLLVGADMLSTVINWHDRNTCFLFADGAGAAVFSGSNEPLTPMTASLDADGKDPSMLNTPSGGTRDPLTEDKLLTLATLAQNAASKQEREFVYEQASRLAQACKIQMRGHEVFEKAVEGMYDRINETLEAADMTTDQITWFLPHQANLVIIRSIMSIMGVSEDKGIINIQRYGNTSAASILIALTEYDRAGKIKPEDNIVAGAFGAGLTSGCIRFRLKEQLPKVA